MERTSVEKKKYGTLNGVRTIACLGIIMMHMAANNTYEIHHTWYTKLVPSFTDFVFVFMVISAFGMCCGYLEAVQKGLITPLILYKRRYMRILPFFLFLILIDLVFNYQKESLPEAFADATLLFGLFPNSISVIGVGWFLGLVFAFYLIFPFYSVLLTSKITAWISFILSLLMNYFGGTYFGLDRKNIVYSLCFFIAGGLIYLYRNELEKTPSWMLVIVVILCTFLYYYLGAGTITQLLLAVAIVCYAVSVKQGSKSLLDNRVVSYVGRNSMEIYLANMLVFRGIEILGMNRLGENETVQYFITLLISIIGTLLFVHCVKYVGNKTLIVIRGKRKGTNN